MKEQVKSKARVIEHGEVFTNDKEVNAMLDMVKQETERIESRFLEPACGDGNFLSEILRRKLEVVKKKYKVLATDYEKYSVIAVSSIYGVDILQDNVYECRHRLYQIWHNEYTKVCRQEADNLLKESIKFILAKNILCGDALSMKQSDGEPIIFSQWDLIMGNQIKRCDYRFDEILTGSQSGQVTLDMYTNNWDYDSETGAMIPKPISEFPPIDYRRLFENEYITI